MMFKGGISCKGAFSGKQKQSLVKDDNKQLQEFFRDFQRDYTGLYKDQTEVTFEDTIDLSGYLQPLLYGPTQHLPCPISGQ